MWDVAFTDSKIDKYEDYNYKKSIRTIYVNMKDFFFKNSRAT